VNKNKYYAEFDTDKYIRETFFPNFEYHGIMVEVGSGPPEFYSMSKHFRDNGWRCICIDPNPKFVDQHKKLNNEIYQVACSFEEKDSTFKIVKNVYWNDHDNGISYSALEIRYDLKSETDIKIEEIPVKVIKLNTLLESLNIKILDFISIDTEGWEIEVLNGFDINTYSPKIVLLENVLHDNSYIKYMNNFGYRLVNKIQYNYIFTKD
jgi:FkbM family methyltransferase